MEKLQRLKYEMLARVKAFGMANRGLFPESSLGATQLDGLAAVLAALDAYLKKRVGAQAGGRRVKAVARDRVVHAIRTMASIGLRVTREEGAHNPFRIPATKSIKGDIDTARSFLEAAQQRRDAFLRFGLPPTFIDDMSAAVDELERATMVRRENLLSQSQISQGVNTQLARGIEIVRDLDVVVAIATADDPAMAAAWRTARRIVGHRAKSAGASSEPSAVPAGGASVVADAAPAAPGAGGSTSPDPLKRAS